MKTHLQVPGTELAVETRGHGPMLLILQAGAGGTEGSRAIAPDLEARFTVVSYARRGLAGAPVPAGTRITLADHADDAARVIERFSPSGCAFVLGVSIGATIGLELVRRHPARVTKLVCHEPPLLGLLDEPLRTQIRQEHAAVEQLFAERGLGAALEVAATLGEIDPDDREPGIELDAPSPELEKSLAFFLANDAGHMRQYEPPLGELAAERIVVSTGASGPNRWIRGIAKRLARELAVPLTEMPGGHIGYQMRPRAFAAALTKLLL